MIHQYLEQIAVIFMGMAGIGFLIAFHELGHFLACKLFGVATPRFSIGFGPRLLSFKAFDTLFSLSAIPLGGYVEIAQSSESTLRGKPFGAISWPKKMVIIAGGIVFNLIFAITALTAVFLSDTPPSPLLYPFNGSTDVRSILPEGAAEQAGIIAGDHITRINTVDIANDPKKLSTLLPDLRGQSATLSVERNGVSEVKTITIPNIDRPVLGIEFALRGLPAAESLMGAFKRAVTVTTSMISSLFSFIKSLVTCRTTKGLGGPVLMFSQAINGVRQGAAAFLILLAFISINLAVMNLIPLPVLDGGQALIVTIEAIMGRELSEWLRIALLSGTWILLMALALYLSVKDIALIFAPCIP